MLEIVSWFVIALVTHILDCYVFCKLIRIKFKISFKIIILCLLFSIIDSFLVISNDLLKVTFSNLITFILLKLIYNKSSFQTLISTLFLYIGFAIADFIFMAVFILLLHLDLDYFLNDYIGILIVNIFDFVVYVFIFRLKFILKFISNIIKWYEENKLFNLIVRIVLAIMMCYLVIYFVAYNKINTDLKLLSMSIVFSIILFVAGYFKEKSSNNKLTVEYTQLLDYVKTYEEEVVDKSKRQHEYKNQLIIIDDMISKTNKKAKEYLKKILNNVESITDNDWMTKLKNLPSGGIKGLIHFKIKKMLENNVSVYVEIDKKLSKKDIWTNVDKNLEDISTVLGVYLDNAIEAAIQAKDRQVIIEFINNVDNIEFVLSNSYSGNINFDDLDKEGYSTKGKRRGLGLSLGKDIINNNKLLSQSRELNGKFYVQKLYIKK